MVVRLYENKSIGVAVTSWSFRLLPGILTFRVYSLVFVPDYTNKLAITKWALEVLVELLLDRATAAVSSGFQS